MTRVGPAARFGALGLALLGRACGDAPTTSASDEIAVVSLEGVSPDDAGIVLRLTGGVNLVDAARASLTVAWVRSDANATTVVIVGPLGETSDVLLVRRRASAEPIAARVVEVANGQGDVSLPSAARAIVRSGSRP